MQGKKRRVDSYKNERNQFIAIVISLVRLYLLIEVPTEHTDCIIRNVPKGTVCLDTYINQSSLGLAFLSLTPHRMPCGK